MNFDVSPNISTEVRNHLIDIASSFVRPYETMVTERQFSFLVISFFTTRPPAVHDLFRSGRNVGA